ncbi:MAG: hypothetical protein ACK5Q5_09160 [Planctomycetaceae bacterium]
MRCRFGTIFGAFVVGLVLTVTTVFACSIPVFRYALERWRPDPFEVLIFHRGELTETQSELVHRLTPDAVPGEPVANVAVSPIDLEGQVRPEFQAIWDADPAASTPWVVVRTPWKGENFTVWQGPLSAESVDTVLRSPVRMELVKRLAAGDSIVWLLLAGSDPSQTAQLQAEVTSQLQDLQKAIALPQIDAADLQELSVTPDQLGLKFSVLTLRRDNPQEQLLVNTLLTVQPGLGGVELADQPMLFPIFGRCRVYYPLVGTAIEPANLEDMARFLSGACQCTIKQQNPGVDLLTLVDWDAYVLGIKTEKPLPPLIGLDGFVESIQPTPAVVTVDVRSLSTSIESPTTVAALDEETGFITASNSDQTAESAPAMTDEPAEESISPTRFTTEQPVTSPAPSNASRFLGERVLWFVGGLTLVVGIVSLWLNSGGVK